MMDRFLSCLMAVSLALLIWLYARSREQETLDNVPVPVEVVLSSARPTSSRWNSSATGPR